MTYEVVRRSNFHYKRAREIIVCLPFKELERKYPFLTIWTSLRSTGISGRRIINSNYLVHNIVAKSLPFKKWVISIDLEINFSWFLIKLSMRGYFSNCYLGDTIVLLFLDYRRDGTYLFSKKVMRNYFRK